jgi:hypothetical protein
LSSDTTENTPFLRRSALAVSRDGTVALGPADTGTAIAVWDLRKRRLQRILPIFHRPVWYTADETISALALSPDGSRVAIGGQSSGQIAIWDLRRGKLVLTFSGHTQVVHSLAWMPDGIALVSSSLDGTVRIWDSGSDHNYDAELLLETLSARCMLVEEVVQELEADRSITPELRNETIQLAKRHGNAFPNMLFIEAWRTGAAPSRPIQEYRKALRRAMVAARLMPWYGRGWTTLAVLQYRTGDSDEALVSSNRAMEMQKSQARDAHAIRAMAFCRLHDSARAQTELDLGRRARGMFQGVADSSLLEEAQSLISAQKAALASIR